MFHVEYVWTVHEGWQHLSEADYRLSVVLEGEDLLEELHESGYLRQAQSCRARCAVGHFIVWQAKTFVAGQPRYVLEIDSQDDEAVVWIADLPTLWEFLRLYAPVGMMLSPWLPGDEDAPICEACAIELDTEELDDDGTF